MSRWKPSFNLVKAPTMVSNLEQSTKRLTQKHIKAVISRGTYGNKAQRPSTQFDKFDLDNVVSVIDNDDTFDNDQGVGDTGGTATSGSSGGNVYEALQGHELIHLGLIKDDGKIDYLGLTDQKPRPESNDKPKFMYSHDAIGEVMSSFHGLKADTFNDILNLAGTLIYYNAGDEVITSYTINSAIYTITRIISEDDGKVINWAATYANGYTYEDINETVYTTPT